MTEVFANMHDAVSAKLSSPDTPITPITEPIVGDNIENALENLLSSMENR